MDRIILLTGVTGHSGQYAIERLVQRKAELDGMRFRIFVRGGSDVTKIQSSGLNYELFYGDITDEAALAKAMVGVDTLLHIVGIRESPRVMQAAVDAGVRRAFLVHTTGIYSRYKAASRDYIEIDSMVSELARKHQIALTILRPTMIYGGVDDQNVITFIRMVDRFSPMPVVSGAKFLLQPVHRRDLGYAYVDALLANEAVTADKNYVLSGKEPILLRDMLTVISKDLGKEPRFLSVPFWIAYSGAWVLFVFSFGKLDLREKVQRLVEPRAYSHEEATADFGYAPMGFAEGVQDEVTAYLAAKKKD